MVHVMLIKLQTKSRLFWTPLRCLKLELCHAFQIKKISTSMLASGWLVFYLEGVITLNLQAPILVDFLLWSSLLMQSMHYLSALGEEPPILEFNDNRLIRFNLHVIDALGGISI